MNEEEESFLLSRDSYLHWDVKEHFLLRLNIFSTHLDDFGLRTVQGKSVGDDTEFVEVDDGEGVVVGAVVRDSQTINEKRLSDDLNAGLVAVAAFRHAFGDEQHVAEEESAYVGLGGHALLELEVAFEEEVTSVVLGAIRHRRRQVEFAVRLDETLEFVVFRLLQ